MTTFLDTAPPLKRLFRRLDFAPDPPQEPLRDLLKVWTVQRADAVAPAIASVRSLCEAPERSATFAFRIGEAGRDPVLLFGDEALEPLLGRCRTGSHLSEAKHPRAAVRLRRLFELVRERGEPVLAQFAVGPPRHEIAVFDILAAPLSRNGRHIDAVLGALSVRRVAAPLSRSRRLAEPAPDGPVLFAFGAGRLFGERTAVHLGMSLAPLEERNFEDGEHKTRPLVSVRGRDVFVIESLAGDVRLTPNDKLCRLLFFIGALKESGADRVTAVTPYLCYARKDRQTKLRDPVTTRYVAQLFEAVGTDRVISMEVHNLAAFQNAFRCDTDHLDATELLVRHVAGGTGTAPTAVVSPDVGGIKRAEAFREALEERLGRPVDKGFMDKTRSQGRITGDLFAGEVEGRDVIIIDDLISSGTTVARVAAACRSRGARRISVAATHGLFAGGADALWREPAIAEVIVTDTVPLPRLDEAAVRGRLTVLDASALVASAIRRCHRTERTPRPEKTDFGQPMMTGQANARHTEDAS